MYTIIRLIMGCVLIMCAISAIKKSQLIRKHIWCAVFTSLSVLLVLVLAFWPFENLLVTFDSPKAAYEYYSLGKSNIELIVEGNNCDFIVDRQGNSDTYAMIPKSNDGWKIGVGTNAKRVVQKVSDGIVLYVYQYKNTSDYFITILDTNGGEVSISDEYDTTFCSLENYNNSLGKKFVTYYAHIPRFDPQYSVTVNGREIALE